MSLNYARELLKITLSQLCDSIGFDTTSEIALDILVDVCERQFQSLSKQTSNLIQLNNRYHENIFDLLSILFENNNDNLEHLKDYMFKFQSLTFSQDIIQFPFKKRNQIYLRIPPKDSQEIIQRDQSPSTDYIYDWLPLFPDQETPEIASSINIDANLDTTIYHDQQKKFDRSDSHHPLTLLSLSSKNDDETTLMPMGKRPNQSLPAILYRPKRIIEMEAIAAAEKAKKEQLDKENNEKDQQQGPPPPLRLTISKPSGTNDKSQISTKKQLSSSTASITTTPTMTLITTTTTTTTTTTNATTSSVSISSTPSLSTTIAAATTATTTTTTAGTTSATSIDGINNKKNLNNLLILGNIPSVNLGKKVFVSPPLNDSPETLIHSQTHLSESLLNTDKNEETALDLTKKISSAPSPAKLPTIKLNIKNVSNLQITNNSINQQESASTTKKQIQRSSSNTKKSTNTHEKVNIKIRTSPLFGTNENNSIISPPIVISNENRINSIETSINSVPTLNDNQQINDFNQANIHLEQGSNALTLKDEMYQEEEKTKKKKKKTHHEHEDKQAKMIKKEHLNNLTEQETINMDTDPIASSSTTKNTSTTNQSSGGAIRLKIKLGKPSTSINSAEISKPDEQFNLTNSKDNQQTVQQELKTSPIRLTLPVGSGNNSTISSSTSNRPPIISTINRSASQKRKSGKVKRVPQATNPTPTNSASSSLNISFLEDNTVSMDEIPLGERTSPNKTNINNIQTNISQPILSTPMKKKTNTNKKKTNNNNNNKRTNNIVGVAVIEERRIDHDSQEKIWICPSCNRPDNGQEAMIACDLCDDWYHWECVGIVEEPPESIPWFCPKCHRSNSSTTSAQAIKPSASSKAKRKRASAIYQQQQQQIQQQ